MDFLLGIGILLFTLLCGFLYLKVIKKAHKKRWEYNKEMKENQRKILNEIKKDDRE